MDRTKLDALKQFEESLEEINVLLALAGPRTGPSVGDAHEHAANRDLGNALTRSCTVMLVAHFEGFVKQALTEFIDEICGSKPPSRRVPDELLELMSRRRLEEIFTTQGEDRIKRTRKLFTAYSHLWEDDRSINPHVISASTLTRQFTSAKSEVIERVLALLGVANSMESIDDYVNAEIRGRGDLATTVRVRIKIDEIVDRRNNIAHGDRVDKPTPQDVEGYAMFMYDVAKAIAALISGQITYCCSLR